MSELKEYDEALKHCNIDKCIEIEQKHNLYGYPPEIVTVGLVAIDKGLDPIKEIDKYIFDIQEIQNALL